MSETARLVRQPLPVGSAGKLSGGWWGVLALIVTEASLFGYLLFTYFYLAAQTGHDWPPEGLPDLLIPGINTIILLGSSIAFWAGSGAFGRGGLDPALSGLSPQLPRVAPLSRFSFWSGETRHTVSTQTCMDRSTLRSPVFTCATWLSDWASCCSCSSGP